MKNLMGICKAVFAALIFTVCLPVQAGVIYDNGDIFPLVGGANFSEGNGRLGDDFTLASNEVVRSVQFWGSRWYNGNEPASDDFSLSIYNRSGNSVGSLVATSALNLVSKIDTGFDHNNNGQANINEYTMDLVNAIALAAGDYLLTIWSAPVPDTNFAWQRAQANGGTSFHSSDNGATWATGSADNNAWNISNMVAGAPVPAPAPLLVLIVGVMGLSLLRRR